MTLGQKLAGYRRLSGMTQQQLGDYLNISPQAISKWEKDLSEPALATLRALAELYKVSVDEILDLKSGFSDMSVLSATEEPSEKESAAPQTATAQTIGFCKECGITVTDENLGAKQPVVLCKSCLEMKETKRKAAAEAERQRIQDEVRRESFKKEAEKSANRRHLAISLSVAGIGAALILFFLIIGLVNDFNAAAIPGGLILTYMVFSFIACLFYDCSVQSCVVDFFGKSLNLPGLIFTFDLDGIIWLIGMKLLFWAIGLIFGIIAALFGIVLGFIISPFVFPFVLLNAIRGKAEY